MANQYSIQYQEALSLAMRLPAAERIVMIEELAASLRLKHPAGDDTNGEETPLSDDEIAALMQVDPLPPAEIVAQGLLGTWAELGIEDGAAWVNEQKHQRKESRKWQQP